MSDPNSATPSPVPPVVEPKQSVLSLLGELVANGTFRRFLAFLLGLFLPLLNAKFGWGLDANVIAGWIVVVVSYILGSNAKAAMDAHADAKVQAAQAAAAAAPGSVVGG